MRHTTGKGAAIATAVVLALAAAPASAQQDDQGLTYAVRAGVGYSDNVARRDGDEIDSMFYSLGGTLRYVRDEGRVDSNVALDLDWIDYDAEGFDSQVYGNIDAMLRYALIPERLSWLFENNFGQGSRNPFTSRSPDNVENINYFSTGPDLTVRFGNAMGAVFDARYSNVWYEDSPNNSDRFGGGANVFYELSTASRVFVRGNYEDVQFDDGSTAPDFDQTDVLGGYSVEGARTSLVAEAGYSKLKTELGDQSGPMYRLSLRRELTESTRATLRLGQEFNDAARDLRSQGDFGSDPNDIVSQGEAYEDRYVEGRLNFNRNRTGLSFGAKYNDQDYVITDVSDRERLQFDARAQRQLNRDWSASVNAQYETVDFVLDDNVDYDETELGASVNWQITPAISTELRYRHYQRPGGSFGTFSENRIWLTGEWSPGRR